MRYLDAGEFVIAAVCGLVGFLVVFFLGDLLQAIIVGVVLAVIWLGVTYAVRRRKGRDTTSPPQ